MTYRKATKEQQKKIDLRAKRFRRWNKISDFTESVTLNIMFGMSIIAIILTLPLWLPFNIISDWAESKKSQYYFHSYIIQDDEKIEFHPGKEIE